MKEKLIFRACLVVASVLCLSWYTNYSSKAIIGYSQSLKVQNYSDLSGLPAQQGDYAYAFDTKSFYGFNGTNWTLGINGNSTPPTVAAGSGAGSGAQITLAGNSRDGKITLVQGTGGLAGGQIMVLTLPAGVSYANGMAITFSAGNANFAGIEGNLYVTTTANTATLMLNGLALTGGATYIGYYHIGGF